MYGVHLEKNDIAHVPSLVTRAVSRWNDKLGVWRTQHTHRGTAHQSGGHGGVDGLKTKIDVWRTLREKCY